MNDTPSKIVESPVQIVAVTFHEVDPITLVLSSDHSGKPYLYVDPFGLVAGDLAAVNVGKDGFKIVRVVRTIDLSSAEASAWVKKPILFRVDYDHELISRMMAKITDVRSTARDLEVQDKIDEILAGKSRPELTRGQASGWYPPRG